jgi:multidrug resistance protein
MTGMNDKQEMVNLLADANGKTISIYDVRSTTRRNFILFFLSLVAILLAISDDIYLPTMKIIEQDLHTTETIMNVSVSIYLITSGLFSLLWGPLSDKFGRKLSLIIALATFFCFTIICTFAPNISIFLVFRALQGCSISACLIVGQGAIADIFPVRILGRAMGIFFIPFLLGPVVGPIVGGWIATFSLGWRGCMLFLAVITFILLIIVTILLPETHQYYVLDKYRKAKGNANIIEAETIPIPNFMYPWEPLKYLLDITILPYAIVSATTYSAMCVAWTLQSNQEAVAPYSLTPEIIGLTYMPAGIGMLIGAIVGGVFADKAALYFTIDQPEGRLVPGLIGSLFLPLGSSIYGWTFDKHVYLVGPLIGAFLLGLGQALFMPGLFSYLSAKKPTESGAIAAVIWLLNFISGGVGITVAVPIINRIGFGIFFSILAAINIVAIGLASTVVYFKLRKVIM